MISQEMSIIIITSAIIGLIFGLIGTIIGGLAFLKVLAMEKSTHTITYTPVDAEIEKANKEYMGGWATQDTFLKEDREMFNEDLEKVMPDFYPEEDDKKVRSF